MIFLRNESLGSGGVVGANTMDLPLRTNLIGTNGFIAEAIGAEVHEEGGLRTMNNQAAFIPQTTDLDIGTGSIHFGCTFKIKSLGNAFGLVGKSIAGGIDGRYAIFKEGNDIFFVVQDYGNKLVKTPISAYNDSNFHKVEGVYDRTKGVMKMIIDSVEVTQMKIPISNSKITCDSKFHIGAYGNATGSAPQVGFFFDGIIKDVFFNKF